MLFLTLWCWNLWSFFLALALSSSSISSLMTGSNMKRCPSSQNKGKIFCFNNNSLLLTHELYSFHFFLRIAVLRCREYIQMIQTSVYWCCNHSFSCEFLHSVPPQAPVIIGLGNEEVKAGSFLRVVCMSYGGNPLATLHWIKVSEL